MITKRHFCLHIIRKFADSEGIKMEDVTEDMIYKSSSLAVALEYLGQIKDPKNQEYAATRGGIFILADTDEPAILSAREMLKMLPTKLEG